MRLETWAGDNIPEPDSETIERIIRDLGSGVEEAAALLCDECAWIQAFPRGEFTLEVNYQMTPDGTWGEIYAIDNVPIDTVIALFQSFNAGETSWRNDYAWRPIELRPISDLSKDLEENTGRSVDDWASLIIQSGVGDRAGCEEWLAKEHGLSASLSKTLTGLAWLIVESNRYILQHVQPLSALSARCRAALRQGDEQEIENCARSVAAVRSKLKTTEDAGEKKWVGVFDDLAKRLMSAASAGSLSSPSDGVVYLLKAGPYYKIGKSINIGQRLNQIKLQLPYPIEEVHRILTDDPRGVEFYWHKRFSNKRTNGEWFLLTDEDVAIFKSRTKM